MVASSGPAVAAGQRPAVSAAAPGKLDAPVYQSHAGMLETVWRYLTKTKSQELLLRSAILILIYLLAFFIRLVRGWGEGHQNRSLLASVPARLGALGHALAAHVITYPLPRTHTHAQPPPGVLGPVCQLSWTRAVLGTAVRVGDPRVR